MALVGGLIGGTGGNVGSASVALLLNTSQFDAGLRSAEGKLRGTAARMDSLGRGMSRIGGSLTRGLSVPLAFAGVAATKMALDYEAAFTKIDAVSNASSKQIASWKEEVKDMAGETARSPQELADALYFLASAGLKANQIMPTLEMSAKAAASGLGETQDVAKLTAQALNAYAKDGLTAAQATDTLVAAVKEGTAEPEEFSTAIGRILPIAQKAGVGFDEVTASLASLSNIGLDVNEGVTAMRGVLQALEAPGTQAAETMKKIGISAEEMRTVISEQGILGAMRLLEERTNGNIDAQRKIIPNIRALTGQFGLVGQEADKVDASFQRVSNSTGEMDKAFATTTRGPQFKFDQALTRLKVAAIDLGGKLLPIVTRFVTKIGELAESFSKLSPDTQDAIVKFGALAIALGPVLSIAGNLLTVFSRLGGAMSKLPGAGGGAPGAVGGGLFGGGLAMTGGAAMSRQILGDLDLINELTDMYREAGIEGAGWAQVASEINAVLEDEGRQSRVTAQALSLATSEGIGYADALRRIAIAEAQGLKPGSDNVELMSRFAGASKEVQGQVTKLMRGIRGTGIEIDKYAKDMATAQARAGDFKGAVATLAANVNKNLVGALQRGETGLNKAGAAAVAAKLKAGDLYGALQKLNKNFTAKVEAETSQAKAQLDSFITTQSGRVITLQTRVQPVAGTVVRAQHGFEGTISRPTMFLAGEAGIAEHVSVRPSGHGRASADRQRPTFVLNFNAPVMGSDVGAIVEKALTDRILKRGALV